MVILIIIFGALTLLAGAVNLVNPERVFGYLQCSLLEEPHRAASPASGNFIS
jgi:hypothetical protein